MKKLWNRPWRTMLFVVGIAFAAAAMAQTVGGPCYATSCRAQDAATVGGAAYGYASGAGYASNTGGDCVGDSCQAGNGNTVGGTCYGDGCKAGDAWNTGGDCFGKGCTPGRGGTMSGNAYPGTANMPCVLGEIYRFPNRTRARSLVNWNTPAGEACRSVAGFQITPVAAPSPMPAATPVTALPPNPWDPANLPKCPFTCQAYNPASGSCVGAPSNVCPAR